MATETLSTLYTVIARVRQHTIAVDVRSPHGPHAAAQRAVWALIEAGYGDVRTVGVASVKERT